MINIRRPNAYLSPPDGKARFVNHFANSTKRAKDAGVKLHGSQLVFHMQVDEADGRFWIDKKSGQIMDYKIISPLPEPPINIVNRRIRLSIASLTIKEVFLAEQAAPERH
jgi:hypothetical protein